MAVFPDWIYKFTPRDEQTTPIEFLYRRLTGSSATTTTTTSTYTVPLGKMLVLTSAALRLSSTVASASVPTRANIFGDPSGAEPASILSSIVASDTTNDGTTRYASGVGSQISGIILPENWDIYASSGFSVAAGTNIVDLHITGILIPRGNFAI